MSFRKHKPENDEDLEAWLMTYADMITLLMAFFVMLLAVSEPKKEKMEHVGEAIREMMGMEAESKDTVSEKSKDGTISALYDDLIEIAEKDNMGKNVSVERTDKGLIMEISSGAFYNSGSADFKKEAEPFLLDVAEALANFDEKNYLIEVAGHTDDVPIKTPKFPSNWELSAARAAGVVRFFIEQGGVSEQYRAMGLADAMPKVPNLDENGKPIPANQTLNRRIVVKIERNEDAEE